MDLSTLKIDFHEIHILLAEVIYALSILLFNLYKKFLPFLECKAIIILPVNYQIVVNPLPLRCPEEEGVDLLFPIHQHIDTATLLVMQALLLYHRFWNIFFHQMHPPYTATRLCYPPDRGPVA